MTETTFPKSHLNRVFLTNGPAPRVSEEILALRRRAGSQGLRNIQPREAYKYLAV